MIVEALHALRHSPLDIHNGRTFQECYAWVLWTALRLSLTLGRGDLFFGSARVPTRLHNRLIASLREMGFTVEYETDGCYLVTWVNASGDTYAGRLARLRRLSRGRESTLPALVLGKLVVAAGMRQNDSSTRTINWATPQQAEALVEQLRRHGLEARYIQGIYADESRLALQVP